MKRGILLPKFLLPRDPQAEKTLFNALQGGGTPRSCQVGTWEPYQILLKITAITLLYRACPQEDLCQVKKQNLFLQKTFYKYVHSQSFRLSAAPALLLHLLYTLYQTLYLNRPPHSIKVQLFLKVFRTIFPQLKVLQNCVKENSLF